MPKGKATSLALTKLERRALENLRVFLEERSNEHTRLIAKYWNGRSNYARSDESYFMSILKLKAILLAADGLKNRQISQQLEISEHSIGRWGMSSRTSCQEKIFRLSESKTISGSLTMPFQES
jgi:hypothetical protein